MVILRYSFFFRSVIRCSAVGFFLKHLRSVKKKCYLMSAGLMRVSKLHSYFICLPAHLGSRSFDDVSKLGVSIFFRSPLTDTWVKLARRATTILD